MLLYHAALPPAFPAGLLARQLAGTTHHSMAAGAARRGFKYPPQTNFAFALGRH